MKKLRKVTRESRRIVVSLLTMMRTESSYPVVVYQLEQPRKGRFKSKLPRFRSKKSLVFLGRLTLPNLLLLNRSWYDVLVSFDCRDKIENGFRIIIDAAKLENHFVVDWFTRRKKCEETIVVHVIRSTESHKWRS